MNTLTNSAIVVIAERNASKYIVQCIDSILSQNYPDLGIVLVDDASDDNTVKIAQERLGNRKDVIVVVNKERCPKIENWKLAIRQKCSNPNSAIFLVDGDDSLTISSSISLMMECHKTHDVVWSQYAYDNGFKGCSGYFGRWIARKGEWISAHMMSFKKHLFDKIDDYYLTDVDGKPLVAAIDQAVMFTLLEMAGKDKCFFLDKILYMYRSGNPISWHNSQKTLELQKRCSEVVRAKRPYILNEGLSIILETQNNKETIANVLESLYFQIPPPVEVLIVDTGSTDGTNQFIKSISVEQYPFGVRFYDAKNNLDCLVGEVQGVRLFCTSADQIYPPEYFKFHQSLPISKLGRGMVKRLNVEVPEYNPTINLRTLSGKSPFEVVSSNFSVGNEFFQKVVKGCKELLSEEFIKKLVVAGAIPELLPNAVSYRIKPKIPDVLPSLGPLGHLL